MIFLWQQLGAILVALGLSIPTASGSHLPYPQTILSDHPVAYWPLNEACGDQVFHDRGEHHLDGTVHTTGVATTQCALANIGDSALAFAGCGGAVDLGNPPELDLKLGPIAIEAWVLVQLPLKSVENIVSRGCPNNGNAGEIALRIADGDYCGGVWDGRPHFARCTVPAEDNGKWVHLVLVYDGNSWLLYRNGKEFARTTDAVGPIHIPTGWKIGAGSEDGDQKSFKGAISNVAIYDIALRPGQIREHYLAGKCSDRLSVLDRQQKPDELAPLTTGH